MSCQFYVLQSRSGNRYMCVGARVQIYKEKKTTGPESKSKSLNYHYELH